MAQNLILEAALEYARNGIPVFPTVGKISSATTHGFKNATTDQKQIISWFESSGYNLALRPADAGVVVVDVDIGADPEISRNLPPTFTVRTPSGGFHYYYHSDIEYGNGKLAPRVDIRSGAGYVLVPPSPGYVVVDAREQTQLPQWVHDKLSEKTPTAPVPAVGEIISHKRLKDILSKIDPGCDYETWDRVIAAVSTLVPDFDLDRAQVLLDWSAGVFHGDREPANYCGDEFDMEAKLASHRSGGTLGTLLYLAGMTQPETPPMCPRDYTVESWIVRDDIPEPQQLIGPINRTSRVLMHAVTGLGKTHFAMMVAAHVAAGKSFQHWNVPAPARVLYIDGEMPPGLMQKRIREMHRRIGADLGRRLWFISRGDLVGTDDLSPLNEPAGRSQIEEWVKFVKADFIIFDNIQSLTTGDLKETESWRSVQSWCQTLGVAHMWVHHSNKDGTQYGDKSRAWQMDTVMSLLSVEGYEGKDLVFDLKFTKKRECDPGNPGDRENDPGNAENYQEGRFSMTKFGWTFTAANKLPDPELELVLGAKSPLTVAELAALFGRDKQTITGWGKGKWARYAVRGYPLVFAIPKG